MGREQEPDNHARHYTQPSWIEGRATTEELAARTAQMWLTNPVNKMQLPEVLMFADRDGDGTIDIEEVGAYSRFEPLMRTHIPPISRHTLRALPVRYPCLR